MAMTVKNGMTNRLDPQTKKELRELLDELGQDSLLLLFSNLIVIILALVQGWDMVPLLWIYWFQNNIIGFFNWRRIRQLQQFSTDGFKLDGREVEATEKSKKHTALFFLLHYGIFQLFYFIFLVTLSDTMSEEVLLSASVGIAIFFFNHFYSYRYNLEKDLTSKPNIGTMMFFPYARIIPMHLIIFIGLWAGRGSRTELFFFLLLKSGADVLMHIIQHMDWSEKEKQKIPASDTQSLSSLHEKGKKGRNKQRKEDGQKKRMTLKQRLKLWFLLGWVAFLLLILITALVMKETNR